MSKRRVRSDKQSRDFHCDCGKSYLSYPALHTHIKKYHQQQEKMMQKAIIPQYKKQKRGRPVVPITSFYTPQFEQLTRFQIAVLSIYTILQKGQEQQILLSGDQQIQIQEFNQKYKQKLNLEQSNWISVLNSFEKQNLQKKISKVVSGITKHFKINAAVDIRVGLFIGAIGVEYVDEERQAIIEQIQKCAWRYEHIGIGQILFDVLMKSLQRHSLSNDGLTQQYQICQ